MDDNIGIVLARILTKKLANGEDSSITIITMSTKDDAIAAIEKIRKNMDGKTMAGKNIILDYKEVDGKHNVIARLSICQLCDAKPNRYCEKCGIVHFVIPEGLRQIEIVEFKKGIYNELARNRAGSRSKS